MDAWQILLPAFIMSVLMIITHAYLGLHVLARGIIFVDLALAQIAGLGVSIAFLFGYDGHSIEAKLYAFIATLIAALAFTGLHKISSKTSREVTIGSVYVLTTALSLLILSRSSQGMEQLKSLFNGNILWVSWQDISLVAIAYGALIVLHLIKCKQFYALSFDDSNNQKNFSFLWEFFFFSSFAIVITLAVNIAGILMVFALLIIPSFSATLLAQAFSSRLLIAWLLALITCTLGLWLSFAADLPVGATVVTLTGLLPAAALIFHYAMKNRKAALKQFK
ncbi:MAG: metal ABC transporter permease [Gammaproteobacteria bacterium]|nr:metal ABC transporter permease [Gammaproteobacteria bacterium]